MVTSGAWIPYCGAAPVPAELLTRWNGDPWLLGGLAAAALVYVSAGTYGSGLSRLKPGRVQAGVPATGSADPTKVAAHLARRRLFFASAWLLLLVLFVSPFCALSSALFSVRVVHHVLLVTVVAPLLVWAFPPAAGLRVPLAWTTAVQALVFWLWHAPPAYGWALSNHAIYWAMQVSLLLTAVAFWAAVRRASAPAAGGALLATMVQMGLLGALITFASRPLYMPHFASTLAWGFAPVEDQQLAGLIMWAPAAGLYLGAALWLIGRWIGPDRGRALPG